MVHSQSQKEFVREDVFLVKVITWIGLHLQKIIKKILRRK
jgi:hypothetical protein